MQRIVLHQYGSPSVLQVEDAAVPVPGPNDLLLRTIGAGINPIDLKLRSGAVQHTSPLDFPAVLGLDIAGTVESTGSNVSGFQVGDRVFAKTLQAYAEFCLVDASHAAHIPQGLDPVDAAALPVVLTTGYQLFISTSLQPGQTILVSGALGSVGRATVFAAKQAGIRIIAAVRGEQKLAAAELQVDETIATEDLPALTQLPQIDAVADTVGGAVASFLVGRVIKGGTFASVLGLPQGAADHSDVRMASVFSMHDPVALVRMAAGVLDGRLRIPMGPRFPLTQAAAAHAAAERGERQNCACTARIMDIHYA